MAKKENTKAYIAWIMICIVWGTTYLAIRIGVKDSPALIFAGLRWLVAGPVLFMILRIRGFALPKKNEIFPLVIISITLLGFGNGCLVFSEQWLPSGLAALLVTTVPFWIAGLEFLMPKGSKINMITTLGLLLGLGGVVIIFNSEINFLLDPSYRGGIIGLMIGVFGWSVGTIYTKYRKINVHPLMGASIEMIFAGILLTSVGLFLGEGQRFTFTSSSLLAFIYLIIFGAIFGYASFIYAVNHLPVSFVSTYAYINPVIALFLGWWILGEELSITIIISAFVIFSGVALVKKGSSMQNSKVVKDSQK